MEPGTKVFDLLTRTVLEVTVHPKELAHPDLIDWIPVKNLPYLPNKDEVRFCHPKSVIPLTVLGFILYGT